MVVAAPAQCIKPSGQAKPGRFVFSEFREAIPFADEGEVPFALTPKVELTLERRDPLQTKLADQESRDRAWNFEIGGRVAAKAPGVTFGRPKKMHLDQQVLARELVRNGKSISAAARTFNVHPATMYRVIEG